METFTTMVERISEYTKAGGALWVLVNAFSYFMALVCAMAAIFQLKDAAENSGRASYKAPLMSFIAASLLASVPTAIQSTAVSIYGDAGNRSPLSSLKTDAGLQSMTALMQFVSFMGYIFFVRGIIVLKDAGQPERHSNASVGKATVILISAMCAIYIDVTLKFVAGISGWDVSNFIN